MLRIYSDIHSYQNFHECHTLFQNFKKFHYWVRHAKCTWSSFIYLYPCNKCLASAKKGIRFLWSSVSLLSRAICHRAQIASLNQPACRLEYKSWRKKLNTCLFYWWYISWLFMAQTSFWLPKTTILLIKVQISRQVTSPSARIQIKKKKAEHMCLFIDGIFLDFWLPGPAFDQSANIKTGHITISQNTN